jgi:putative ABC transport system substrate-binding protein
MRRRDFITLAGTAAVAWPLAARAQPQAVPVVGVLYSVLTAQWTDRMNEFRQGLGEAGFVEGRNVDIEYRWAEGHLDRIPAMAADLVGRKVSVVLAGGNVDGVRAAITAMPSIPIVFTTATDPVATGLVGSLNRPGGHVTGVTFMGDQLVPKLLELLHELIPAATRIALLVNPANVSLTQIETDGANEAGKRLGVEIVTVRASTEPEIDDAFAAAVQQGAAALVMEDAFLISHLDQIGALGLHHRLPVVSGQRTAAHSSLLMSYGALLADTYRQAGVYVGRILKGEKPGELPVLQPTKFDLVVNLKTAKALGLKIPESFLVRADEVIE